MASIRTERETEHLGRKNTTYELDNYGIKVPLACIGTSTRLSSMKRSRVVTKAFCQTMALL
jgi:hypothetical protein